MPLPASSCRLSRFDRAWSVRAAMRVFDVAAALQPRVRFQTIRFRNSHARLARDRVFAAGDRDEWPARHRRGFRKRNLRQLSWPPRQRKILSQRKMRVAVPHQNAAQVGMAAKTNAHHVVNLAPVPIRPGPDCRYRWQFAFFFTHVGFEPQMAGLIVSGVMINHREPWIVAVIIEAADIHQVIAVELFLAEPAHLDDAFGIAQPHCKLPAKFLRLGNQLSEARFEFVGKFERGHNRPFRSLGPRVSTQPFSTFRKPVGWPLYPAASSTHRAGPRAGEDSRPRTHPPAKCGPPPAKRRNCDTSLPSKRRRPWRSPTWVQPSGRKSGAPPGPFCR